MMDDLALLRAYATDGSEEAFRTVVDRHLGLVYSSALRQVRDPHLAEEVAQAVFLILARKAASLRPATLLTGWLFRTTRFAASEVLRAARRRRHYEQEAAQMLPTTTPSAPEASWEEVAPFLDEAIADLGETDRHAILLRFFERKDLKEVGHGIGSTEEAAKKRVSRALEKIRCFLARRGVALSVTTLASAVMANSVRATPPALSHSIVAAAAKGTSAITTISLINQTMKAVFVSKIQTAATIVAILVFAAGTGTLVALKAAETKGAVSSNAKSPASAAAPASATAPAQPPPAKPLTLVFDSENKEYKVKAGDVIAPFTFYFTNASASEVVITHVQPACGCTTANNLPAMPWRLPPGTNGHIDLTLNLSGRSGAVIKTVAIGTSVGSKTLVLRTYIPTNAPVNGLSSFPVKGS